MLSTMESWQLYVYALISRPEIYPAVFIGPPYYSALVPSAIAEVSTGQIRTISTIQDKHN